MKKSIIFITVFLSSLINSYAEDVIDIIYLKDSTVIEGNIIEQVPNKTITIKKLDGEYITINFENIEKITKTDRDKVSYKKINYWEAGINIGTPGILNVLVGRWFYPIGIKVSGMSLGSMYGIQGNLMYRISDNYSTSHSVGLSFGIMHQEYVQDFIVSKKTEIYDWKYFGMVYNLNWSGFWLELGIGRPFGSHVYPYISKSDSSISVLIRLQPIFQIGYTYRFID